MSTIVSSNSTVLFAVSVVCSGISVKVLGAEQPIYISYVVLYDSFFAFCQLTCNMTDSIELLFEKLTEAGQMVTINIVNLSFVTVLVVALLEHTDLFLVSLNLTLVSNKRSNIASINRKGKLRSHPQHSGILHASKLVK